MNAFQRALWRFLRPTEPMPTIPEKGHKYEGPQINPGVSPGTAFKPFDPTGPQINPGLGDVTTKGGNNEGPQINPGPGDDWIPRVNTLGLGRRAEPVYSSRPFGPAQDDTFI